MDAMRGAPHIEGVGEISRLPHNHMMCMGEHAILLMKREADAEDTQTTVHGDGERAMRRCDDES